MKYAMLSVLAGVLVALWQVSSFPKGNALLTPKAHRMSQLEEIERSEVERLSQAEAQAQVREDEEKLLNAEIVADLDQERKAVAEIDAERAKKKSKNLRASAQ